MLGREKKKKPEPTLQNVEPSANEALLAQIIVIEQEVHRITVTNAAKQRIQTACAMMRALLQLEEVTKS